ncbi:MAG: endonuclease domain-containing protein [Chryseolinea sp.]
MSWLTNNLNFGATPGLFLHARKNRKRPTKAEHLLWCRLRNRKLHGFKFRRQHPIKHFIADFFCAELKLVIEVDGGYHMERSQLEYDGGRTFELNELGIKTIRFSNEQLVNDLEGVLAEIITHLK